MPPKRAVEGGEQSKAKRTYVRKPDFPKPSGAVSSTILGGWLEVGKEEYAQQNRAALEERFSEYLNQVKDRAKGFQTVVDGMWPSVNHEEYWIYRSKAEGRTVAESKAAAQKARDDHARQQVDRADRKRRCAEFAGKLKSAFHTLFPDGAWSYPGEDIETFDEFVEAMRGRI